MTLITLVPSDSVIIIDSQAARPIDFTGIDPTIHAIQWYGVSGWLEFKGDPVAQTKPSNLYITSLTPYQSFIDQATDIIYWQNNPEIYYCTLDGTVYGGNSFILGQQLVINTPDQVLPTTGFTQTAPPVVVENYTVLYWYDDNWLISSVDPTLSLADAKTYLIQEINTNSALLGTVQARVYSPVQLFDSANVNLLLTADYALVTLADYQVFLDGQVTTMTATINSAATVAALYNFDPVINGAPAVTTFNVTNNLSGNYVINGESNPSLPLIEGYTYTFNVNAVGHPFWIKTTLSTGTADQYNTGVTNNGTDNGVITFLVPVTGIDSTLYYNCQYHASMAGVLNISA